VLSNVTVYPFHATSFAPAGGTWFLPCNGTYPEALCGGSHARHVRPLSCAHMSACRSLRMRNLTDGLDAASAPSALGPHGGDWDIPIWFLPVGQSDMGVQRWLGHDQPGAAGITERCCHATVGCPAMARAPAFYRANVADAKNHTPAQLDMFYFWDLRPYHRALQLHPTALFLCRPLCQRSRAARCVGTIPHSPRLLPWTTKCFPAGLGTHALVEGPVPTGRQLVMPLQRRQVRVAAATQVS